MTEIPGRVPGAIERGPPFEFEMDGRRLTAYAGETLAAALMAAGQRVLRRTALEGAPRGMYCGMGVCFDCLVVVDGVPNVRACQTAVAPGMKVATQQGLAAEGNPP